MRPLPDLEKILWSSGSSIESSMNWDGTGTSVKAAQALKFSPEPGMIQRRERC